MKSLSDFRVDDGPGFVLRPVECSRSMRGIDVLSVDQTLNASGWGLLRFNHHHDAIEVRDVGMIGTETIKTSHEGNLDQSDKIYLAFKSLLLLRHPQLVVHEYPPVSRPGLKISRPESSLLAAAALRHAARDCGIPVYRPIPAQSVKVRFCGDPKASKADIKVAVETLDPSVKTMKPMNENVRDAIANGWFAMEEGQP